MSLYIYKILITGIIIVLVTEIAKINDRLGALIAAMPITTFLVLIWLHFENVSTNKIFYSPLSAHLLQTNCIL